jgi:hypothetical protein
VPFTVSTEESTEDEAALPAEAKLKLVIVDSTSNSRICLI